MGTERFERIKAGLSDARSYAGRASQLEDGNENGEASASPETADSDPRPIESDTNKGISR